MRTWDESNHFLGQFEANVGSIRVNLSCMEHLGSIVCQLDYSWVNPNDISELRDQKLWFGQLSQNEIVSAC